MRGEGIEGINVSLDGETITSSSSTGAYDLDQIKPGTYTLEGNHPHMFFDPVPDLQISIWLDKLPDLVLSFLHICGQVKLNYDEAIHEYPLSMEQLNIRVYLESKTEKRSTIPSASGSFCFEARPGKYDLYTQS